VSYLIQNWAWMPYKYQALIRKEIQQAIDNYDFGMEMDKTEWLKILELPINE